jgi:hypothetical protein
MAQNSKKYRKSELQISEISTTREKLSGRAGLSLFVAYLHSIEIFALIDRFFGTIRKNKKGLGVFELFKQILCFMVDGSSRHLTYFDHIARDEGYAASIETDIKQMASSHSIKRFFKAFAWTRVFLFRRLLQALFVWRLKIKQPQVVELGIDTMVLDNDDAKVRHGVKATYKKKKGFQPLQMNWGRLIVDAVFRSGDKHSNHGDTVQKMIGHIVAKIRKKYRSDVPIIIRMDSGFFDQKIFRLCERLAVGYVCGGKIYKDIKSFAQGSDDNCCYLQRKFAIETLNYIDWKRRSGGKIYKKVFCGIEDNRQAKITSADKRTGLTAIVSGPHMIYGIQENFF